MREQGGTDLVTTSGKAGHNAGLSPFSLRNKSLRPLDGAAMSVSYETQHPIIAGKREKKKLPLWTTNKKPYRTQDIRGVSYS